MRESGAWRPVRLAERCAASAQLELRARVAQLFGLGDVDEEV